MICQNCQKVNQEDALYCPYCGFAFQHEVFSDQINGDDRKDEYQYQQREYQQSHQQNQHDYLNNQYYSTNNQSSEDSYQQNGNERQPIANNYFRYFQNALKNPNQFSSTTGKVQYVHGYITLVLTALFYGLTFTVVFNNLFAWAYWGANTSDYFVIFLSSFVWYISWLALTAALLFVVVKYLMKINITFHHIIARFGTFSNISLITMAISFIFAITGIPYILILVLMVNIIIHFVLVFMTIHSFNEQSNSTFDPIYAGLIVSLVTIFIYQFIAQSYIGNIVDSLF